MSHHEDPLAALGPALVCALVAQVVSVLLAAVFAAQVPGGYRVRSFVFLATLLWSVAGTVLLLIRTAGGSKGSDAAKQIRFSRIALWVASSWVWPVLLPRRRPTSEDGTPR